MELPAFNEKPDGVLGKILATVVPMPDRFEVPIGPVQLLARREFELEALRGKGDLSDEERAEEATLCRQIESLEKQIYRMPFRGVEGYTDLQDMTDRAKQFEELLRKGRIPAVPKDLIPPRAGDAAKAQFLAYFCLETEFQEPGRWLLLQKTEGLLFQFYFDAVSEQLTLRTREAETVGIEEKKDNS